MFNTNDWLAYGATSNKFNNTYIQGILDICGNITLRTGGFSLPNGDVSMNGNLYVGLETAMRGNVNIQGNLVVNKRVLQTLKNDPSYNAVNGYYALAENVQPIVSRQTAYDIGQNWLNSPQIFSTQPVSLCWSPELGLFCSGCAGAIVNSRDGLTWNTIGVPGGYGNSNDICWSPELRIFVVIAYSNHRCATSPDGFTWTIRTGLTTLSIANGHDIQWGSVCWSRELGLFCAVGNDAGASFATKSEAINNYCVALSSDGINWNLSTSGVKNYYWVYVCWSAELGLFCAVSFISASNNRIMVSRDGYNWSNATNGNGSYNYIQVCWSPELGLFCAVGDNGIILSRDGYNWSSSISGVRNTRWEGVCWSPELGLFCAVSPTASTGNNEVIISRDGYNWTEATSGVAPIGWGNVCWSPELSIFCSLSYSGTNTRRAMITNPAYRLPTTKSIQTLTNDGYYNINIASTPSGTFPNFRTTATGPNLISIGNGNYKLVGNLLSNSIAIGNTILNANNPTGYGIIGMGQNVFPQLTTGFQNIGIGNAIATTMATGYNNVFIGNGVATSTNSTGNTVAIGTNAGFTNATGINNTYLGAFTGANAVAYSNSTAIGYGATITASNQIKLGTANETTNIDGNLVVNKTIQTTNLTVSGTTSLISDITLPGNLIVNNTTPSYNVNSGSFQLKGGAGILGNVFINQNLSVAQVSTFSGNVSLNGIQNTFTGDVSMNGNLQVNKTSIFNGNVRINGNITFSKDVSMNSNLWIPNNATVGGDVSMNGNLYVGKISTFIGNVSISGFSNLRDASMNGNIYVSGQTTLVGNVNIQGNLVVNKRVLQTLKNDTSYNSVNGYYALAENVQPIVSKQTAYDIGQNWVNAKSGVISNANGDNQWTSVCWSPELGLFCAVAQSGNTNERIMISSDGLNWRNAINVPSISNWFSVCWSPKLGLFCAVGYSTGTTTQRVIVSTNGLNWNNATDGVLTNDWLSVCWSPELELFCAVAYSGTTANERVMISRNGYNWTSATSGVLGNNWYDVCWSPELGLFCAVATTGTANERVMVSSDGLRWRNATTGVLGNDWYGVCWSPELGLFCAVATSGTTNQRVMVSSDGLNWRNATSGVLELAWASVCWAPEIGLFCAVAFGGGAANQRVMVSRDGLNWSNATSGVLTGQWFGVCWSPELSSFCAIDLYVGTANQRVMITNPIYRLPTTKSIQTLLNDGNYNINIASTPSGTFPNFRTTATGPNLISIGNGNYKLVSNTLRDSIAIGNTILNGGNPNGYGIIGMGQNVFPQLITGFQNIGIGNAIATLMATGYNNVFIGNSVATSTNSTGNTVAIGTNAGRTNTTGINNTYLGAFTDASLGTYSNSTAIGYGAKILSSNEIVLGTLTEHVRTPGNPYWYSGLSQTNKLTFVPKTDIAIAPAPSTYQNSFSNRITIHNTYFLVVPEFAYGIYRAQLNLNLDPPTTMSKLYFFKIYQYTYANAITSNIISTGTTPKNPVNSLLSRNFEFNVGNNLRPEPGNNFTPEPIYQNDSSIDHSCLFEYAPETTNRAFLFTWNLDTAGTTTGDIAYYNGSLNIWSWITLYKVA